MHRFQWEELVHTRDKRMRHSPHTLTNHWGMQVTWSRLAIWPSGRRTSLVTCASWARLHTCRCIHR